ncbi:solute carrier family 15 member 4-like [Diadema antillarum]|uniref:solute carrier family 15 member 4-like n=2 Tax=Diadema TaxID=31174 RepID=UPI003A88DFCF
MATYDSVQSTTDDTSAGPSLTHAGEASPECRKPSSRDIALFLCIAAADFVEKIIYYGIVVNLVLYCTNDLDYSSADAAVFSLVFTGTNYVLTSLGGWIADGYLGMYNAIYLGLLICLVGTAMLPLIAYDWSAAYGPAYGFSLQTKRNFFILTLAIVNVGTSPIKACTGPYAGVQMEEFGVRTIQAIYHWIYLIAELAPLFSYSLLSYIEQDLSFTLGFLVMLVFNVVVIFVFCAGRDLYKNRPTSGNKTLRRICQMLWKAATYCDSECSLCCCCGSSQPQPPHQGSRVAASESSALLSTEDGKPEHIALVETGAGHAGESGIKPSDVEPGNPQKVSCLDRLKVEHGGTYSRQEVEELEWFLNTLLVLSVVILYNTIRFQYSTTYLLQAERLNLDGIPVALLALFVPLFVIITVPLVDRVVYPLLERSGVRVSMIRRMACGLVCAFLSLLSALIVEIVRKQILSNGGSFDQVISGTVFRASTLSIYAQIPQYMFIGIGDVFILITGLEFAFSQSPKSLQAFITGIYLFYNGIGSYVGSLLITIANAVSAGNEWIPNDINKGHLEYYFGLLIVVNFFNMAYLYCITRNYKYVTQYETNNENEDQC